MRAVTKAYDIRLLTSSPDFVCRIAVYGVSLFAEATESFAYLSFGQERANLKDASKVASIPRNVPKQSDQIRHGKRGSTDEPPECGFQAMIHAEDSFVLDDLGNTIQRTLVLACTVPILQTDFDKLERDNNE